jgi:hypothetical protein
MWGRREIPKEAIGWESAETHRKQKADMKW